jgi:hypothetical protein
VTPGNDVIAYLRSRTLNQHVALLASALLLLTIGLCVLHSASGCFDSTDQGMPSGLCAGAVMILGSLLLFPGPRITGEVLFRRKRALTAIYCDVFDRPPKIFSSLAVPPLFLYCRAL